MILHKFVMLYRDEIIRECRERVATRSKPPATDAEIDHGGPMSFDEFADELRKNLSLYAAIATSAKKSGCDLERQECTVSQAVRDYGEIVQSFTDQALDNAVPISADDFRMLDRCLDDWIANRVTEFTHEREQSPATRELRTPSTALFALTVIEDGRVGVADTPLGAVLKQTLMRIAALVESPPAVNTPD